MNNALEVKRIPSELYSEILRVFPRACVDAVICCQNKVLLLKRIIKPDKGLWAIVGGRVFKEETVIQAVQREILEELGLIIDTDTIRLVGVVDCFHKTRHDISITYALVLENFPKIKIDYQHSEYKWFDVNSLPADISRLVPKQVELFKEIMQCQTVL